MTAMDEEVTTMPGLEGAALFPQPTLELLAGHTDMIQQNCCCMQQKCSVGSSGGNRLVSRGLGPPAGL